MKRSFILFVILFVCLSLFAEGNPKAPHNCSSYSTTNEFVPDWFDFLEFADDNSSAYDEEFLKEHGGRAGILILQIQDPDYPWLFGKYFPFCSGTLIGESYFITAGHCAVTKTDGFFPTENGTETIQLTDRLPNS